MVGMRCGCDCGSGGWPPFARLAINYELNAHLDVEGIE